MPEVTNLVKAKHDNNRLTSLNNNNNQNKRKKLNINNY